MTLNAREILGPLQTLQQVKVKEEAEDFRGRVNDFVRSFKEKAPFKFEYGCDNAYRMMDEWNSMLVDIEREANSVSEQQELFEVQVVQWRDIKTCRQELAWLKLMWDHVQLVQEIFASYRATLWSNVDVDMMAERTRKLQKEIKALPRQTTKWDVYERLLETIGHMSVSLPLVQDLREDSMRERHWKKLMAICGKTFVMDEKLQLDQLLKLELHLYQDPVAEIVEQSRAEIKIDLQLQKIISTWEGLRVQYKLFKTTGVSTLEQPTEVYEALDDNEVVLQNMMGNRFMGHFEGTITEWKGSSGLCAQSSRCGSRCNAPGALWSPSSLGLRTFGSSCPRMRSASTRSTPSSESRCSTQ